MRRLDLFFLFLARITAFDLNQYPARLIYISNAIAVRVVEGLAGGKPLSVFPGLSSFTCSMSKGET